MPDVRRWKVKDMRVAFDLTNSNQLEKIELIAITSETYLAHGP